MRVCAVDIETFMPTPENPAGKPVCLQWESFSEKGIVIQNFRGVLARLLSEYDRLVFFNASFDIGTLVIYGHLDKKLAFDLLESQKLYCCMLAEDLYQISTLGEKVSPGLEATVKYRLGLEMPAKDKKIQTSFSTVAGIPVAEWPKVYRDYAESDPHFTLKLYYDLQARIKPSGEGSVATLPLQQSAHLWLFLMSKRGVSIDPTKVAELESRLMPEYKMVTDKLVEMGLAARKKDGTLEIKQKEMRLRLAATFPKSDLVMTDPSAKFPEGQISLKGEFLLDLPTGHDFLETYIQHGEITKAVTTYLPALKKGLASGGKVFGDYNALVKSGRTSCFGGSSGDMPMLPKHQLPRVGGIRECLVPSKPNNYLIAFDYATIELATTAQLMIELYGKSEMATQINAGVDLHAYLGSKIAGLSYDEFYKRLKEGDKTIKHFRQTAKPINLSYPGGVSPKRTAVISERQYGVPMSRDRAIELFFLWFETFPEMKRWLGTRRMCPVCADRSWDDPRLAACELCWGSKLVREHGGDIRSLKKGKWFAYDVLGFYRNHCTFNAAANGKAMQTRAALGAKIAGTKIERDLATNAIEFVHDELIFDMPLDCARIETIANYMARCMKKVCPDIKITVEAKAMKNYSSDESTYFWTQSYSL